MTILYIYIYICVCRLLLSLYTHDLLHRFHPCLDVLANVAYFWYSKEKTWLTECKHVSKITVTVNTAVN